MTFLRFAAFALLMQAATATPPQTAKGSIEGTVVQARNGAPLPGVRVILARSAPAGGAPGSAVPLTSAPTAPPPPPPPPPPPAPPVPSAAPVAGASTFVFQSVSPAAAGIAGGGNLPTATTDSQGRYLIKDVEPGSYRVTFASNGYVKQEYGQHSFSGQGAPVAVTAGKSVKDIDMSMTQAGNLSGHIRDTSGVPAAGVPIQLLRASYSASGQKSFQSISTDKTDDRGEYRLYWLSPGRYYVNAGTSPGPTNRPVLFGGGAASPNQMPGESFTYTYYPGVTSTSQAVAIDIGAGAEVGGIDFAVQRQQLLNVRGKVVDTRTGASPAAVNISLAYQAFEGGGSFSSANNYNASTGTFELVNLIPGSYAINATVQDNTVNDPASRARLSSASLAIDVFNGDLENVVLNLVPGFPLAGRFRVEGKQLPPNSNPRLQMRSSQNGVITNTVGGSSLVSPVPDADGNFRFDGVHPGEFRVALTNMLPEYHLKEVRLNGVDVLNQPMQFPGVDNAFLDVVISSGAIQVEGTTTDAKSMPEPGVSVVLIPDQHRDRADLYKFTTTDATGKYLLRGIAPGDYKLFAWDSMDPYAWFDPEIQLRNANKGTSIHVVESANQNVDLKVITEP